MTDAERIHDLRHALRHEHAHRLIAQHFGVVGIVDITAHPEGGIEQGRYTGQFRYYNAPPTKRAQRLIGLAGTVANLLASEPDVTAWDLFDYLEYEPEFSPTDRALAGRYTVRDIEMVLQLLRQYGPALVEEVKWGEIKYGPELDSIVARQHAVLAELRELIGGRRQHVQNSLEDCPKPRRDTG